MAYRKIADQSFHVDIPTVNGIYKIVSLDHNGNPVPTRRLLGEDEEGILYIGKCNNLNERAQRLRRVLQPHLNTKGHTFGINYKALLNVQKAFPYSSLAIAVEVCNEPLKREAILLEEYRQKFGEVPPLNARKGNL